MFGGKTMLFNNDWCARSIAPSLVLVFFFIATPIGCMKYAAGVPHGKLGDDAVTETDRSTDSDSSASQHGNLVPDMPTVRGELSADHADLTWNWNKPQYTKYFQYRPQL